MLEFAKLDREEIKPVTQTIYFSEQLENDVVKLLEVDSTVLKALESGERYNVKPDLTLKAQNPSIYFSLLVTRESLWRQLAVSNLSPAIFYW